MGAVARLFLAVFFIAGLLRPASPSPPGLEAQKRLGFPLLQVGVAAGLSSIPQLGNGVPKGYLRVIVFTRDSVLAPNQPAPVQLSQAASGGYEPLRLQVVLPQDGYVTAYVGNESDVDVLFDDVSVEHRPGLQVQETQYDPAGLELAGLAPPSPGIKGLNNYRFNGKEFQADLGLGWNHQDWRFLDPATLRWNGVDPEVENGQESWTPYSFGFDNAVRYADADGRCPCEGDPPITVAGIIKSTFYGLAASVANTALAMADYRSPEGIIGMLSGQSYRATVGADGISYEKRPAVTSERQAAGYIGADALDMASTALTVATMGEGAAVGRGLPMATGLLLEQGAGKVAQNEAVQLGKRYITGTHNQLTRAGLSDSHHIIQDAAVRDLPGYSRGAARTIQLPGRSRGTPHHAANQMQGARRRLGDGGTYAAERRIGYRAMRAAGVPRQEAKQAVREADDYFSGLGVNLQTPTNIPRR